MRLTVAAAAVAVLALCGAAQAQTSASASPDPARVELARQLVEASGGRQQAEATLKMLYGGMGKAIAQSLPPDKSQLMTVLMQDLQDDMLKLTPQLLDASIQVYAANLTETELRDELAWMHSDSGRSITAKMPVVRQQMMQAQIPMIMTVIPKLMQKAVDQACEQSQCTPQQRQAIAAAAAKVAAGGAS